MISSSPSGGDEVIRTKILLTGLRRSGKTSIQQVLFNSLSPKDAFFIEPTTKIVKSPYDTVIPLEIWDCPGNATTETLGLQLVQFSTMIFVIDIQDLYQQPIARLVDLIITACQDNPAMNLEVFVHKSEALSEEYKIENFRHIQQRVLDELLDISFEYEQVPINFHLTSIHDHSLQDAFSRVLHKLIDSLPYIEDLLNVFCGNSQSSKAFLFDMKSRLYVATDASPVDSATHNLCSDYLQMLNSFGPLYRSVKASPERYRTASIASPSASASEHASSSPSSETSQHVNKSTKQLSYASAATSLSPGHSGTSLTFHVITPQLALLALLPTSVYEMRRGLVEYNVVFFREGVQEIWQCEMEARKATT